MKKTINFWTKKEVRSARKLMREIKSKKKVAEILSKEFNRPFGGVYAKLFYIQKGATLKRLYGVTPQTNVSKSSVTKNMKSGDTLKLPEGFYFDLVSKRITMHKNHVRVYF